MLGVAKEAGEILAADGIDHWEFDVLDLVRDPFVHGG
jgi:hypothetical protein